MKKYFNKFTMSILMVGLSLLTMVATTYAWVGLLSNSTLDNFNINVKQATEDDSDYGIELSLTGEEGSFADDIDLIELKKQILMNTEMYNLNDLNTENKVNEAFRKHRMVQCSARLNTMDNHYIQRFSDMGDVSTKNYYKFDIYISIYKIGNETDYEATLALDLYLRNFVLSSDIVEFTPMTEIIFPSVNPSGKTYLGNPDVVNSLPLGTIIGENKLHMDPSSACRLSVQRHNVVDKYALDQYDRRDNIEDLHIYQNGTPYKNPGTGKYEYDKCYPTYDSETGVYDFGGILPDEYNYAQLYHNELMKNPVGVVSNEMLNRGDVIFADDGDINHIIDTDDGVTTSKMVKFTFCFWFEGWDSDCYMAVDNKTVNVNLEFSTKNPNDN